MRLVVDIGNSRVKWASARGVRLEAHGSGPRLALSAHDGPVVRSWSQLPKPQAIVACNVGGAAARAELEALALQRWRLQVTWISAVSEAGGVRNVYPDPPSLGADRWAALIAARYLGGEVSCVVDCGTAVTVDALAADGSHLGGVIFGGVTSMRQTLANRTAQIHEVRDHTLVHSVFGTKTRDAVAAGTAYAAAGGIDRVVAEVRDATGTVPVTWLTGGEAAILQPLLTTEVHLRPDLVLLGLARIAMLEAGTAVVDGAGDYAGDYAGDCTPCASGYLAERPEDGQ